MTPPKSPCSPPRQFRLPLLVAQILRRLVAAGVVVNLPGPPLGQHLAAPRAAAGGLGDALHAAADLDARGHFFLRRFSAALILTASASATGLATAFPSSRYLALSLRGGSTSNQSSRKPCSRQHSTGIRRRTVMPALTFISCRLP